jgi:glycosyltransferase involved in cell wall biosynthesis
VTSIEKNLLNLQDRIFVSSNYTKNIFELNGVENVTYVPLGFDPDFHITDKIYLEDKIHFGLLGKFESRKNTARIIKAWLKLFGNNSKYQLSCAITNPFLDKAKFQNELLKTLEGKQYNNLNFVPYMQTNSEVNDFLNSIDIDLGGLSGAEGWNLPSFNATALGKWSVVINATAHKDWATNDNSILIEPSSLKDCYDDVFFKKGQAFNQGQFFNISDEEMENAILKSVSYAKKPNPEGVKLQKEFTYEKTVETILCAINSQV